MIVVQSVTLALLFGLSAFFSASETAITALSVLKMKRLSVVKPGLVADFTDWLAKPHRLLVTILVGNTCVNLAISSLSATMVLPLARRVSVEALEVVVWLAATGALLVFGEIIPKIIGRAYREPLSVLALPLLQRFTRLFGFVFAPFHWMMERLAPGMERAPVSRLSALSFEEVRHMLGEFQATGEVAAEAGEMLARVLALPQRTVGEIRQPADRVDTVAMEVLERGPGSPELFVDLLVETGRTRVPVTRNGVPAGHVQAMDLLKEWRGGRGAPLEALVRPVRRVPPDMKVLDLLALFRAGGNHVAFVTSESGEFLGLVTLEDVLEEIVGEILDEYDLERKKG